MESLKTTLLTKLQDTEGYISKGELHLLAEQEGYSPEYCGRELRKMAEDGIIQVSHYQGKRGQTLARYSRIGIETPKPPKITYQEVEENGIRIMKPLLT